MVLLYKHKGKLSPSNAGMIVSFMGNVDEKLKEEVHDFIFSYLNFPQIVWDRSKRLNL